MAQLQLDDGSDWQASDVQPTDNRFGDLLK